MHESGSLRIADFGCSMKIDTHSNPSGMVSNTAGTIAFWPPEAITSTTTTTTSGYTMMDPSGNKEEVRGPEHSFHDVNDLPPLHSSSSHSRTGMDLDVESLPPMMESYDVNDLDSLPPMTATTSHDILDLPPMDLNNQTPMTYTNSNTHSPNPNHCPDLNDLPPMDLDLPPVSMPTSVSMTDDNSLKFSSFGADIWAAGVTAHCFLFGSLPFSIEGSNPVDILNKIAAYHPPTDFSTSTCSSSLKERYSQRTPEANAVWSKLLTNDPASRLTLSEAFKTTWLSAEASRREKNEKKV